MSQDEIRSIGVVGAGTMGSGIALTALLAGFDVVLQDPFPEALERAGAYIQKHLDGRGENARLKALSLVTETADCAPCQVVIEAALEEIALKTEIFRSLETACSPNAILASNTSTLSITRIAAQTSSPRRVAGMHFFNPAPVLPLVEIVRGAGTEQCVIESLVELARRMGKTPVVVDDRPGFIVNRVARPYYGEALRLLGEGVLDHAAIDLVMRLGGGFRMGPFQLMDLIGIDINTAAMRSMHEQSYGEDRYRPHPIQIRQSESGDLGKKTGRGFYEYRGGPSGIRDELPPEPSVGEGAVQFFGGRWACGLENLLISGGYRTEQNPEEPESIEAVFLTQAHDQHLQEEIQCLDWLVPENAPVFVQCLDGTLDGHLPGGSLANRFIGIDTLFLVPGRIATLVPCTGISPSTREKAEAIMRSLGRLPVWIEDAPGMVLPRIVGMLINEAAFALQDGIADEENIDLAMKLGVNYPKGPLSWGRELGWMRILCVLEHLQREYGEDRYRPCQLIRKWARAEGRERADLAFRS